MPTDHEFCDHSELLIQVRSYTFSPDSGKIDCIRYDALGWPAIPERLVGVWEVGVECIQEIDGLARITLLPGAEVELNRISDGPLELAFVALQVRAPHCFDPVSRVSHPRTYRCQWLPVGAVTEILTQKAVFPSHTLNTAADYLPSSS